MAYFCFRCGKEISLGSPSGVGRRDTCPACDADLHSCLNCTHYDGKAYNECHEPQADRVLDKDRSNYCDYFAFRSGAAVAKKIDVKEQTQKKLDDLFKK